MATTSEEAVFPGEIELYVENFYPSSLPELGTLQWLNMHGRFVKIAKQAVLDATRMKDEFVKDTLVLHEKIPVIVHEVICSSLWRQNVLPRMIKIKPDPNNTLKAYLILYHEASAVSLLETVLYHEETCETLGDSVVDLIDYCVHAVTYSLTGKKVDPDNSKLQNMSGGDCLMLEEHRLKFDNGIRSISILRCLAEFLDNLPLSATTRMYETYDVPLLFIELIDNSPWLAEDSSGNRRIYKDGNWLTKEETKLQENGKLLKVEGQVWLGLVLLLLDGRCQAHYEINESRKNRLLKLQRHLHEDVLDQLSPLVDLKKWLSHLSVTSPPNASRPAIMEVIPEIQEGLLRKYSKKWEKIAELHVKSFFNSDNTDIKDMIKSLDGAYDLSSYASFATGTNMCANGCGSNGIKRCSRCKAEWYCGRECQVNHWPKHKRSCELLAHTE